MVVFVLPCLNCLWTEFPIALHELMCQLYMYRVCALLCFCYCIVQQLGLQDSSISWLKGWLLVDRSEGNTCLICFIGPCMVIAERDF